MKLILIFLIILFTSTSVSADGGGGGGGAGPFGPFPIATTTGAGGYSNYSSIVQYPLQRLLKFSIITVWEQKKIVNK